MSILASLPRPIALVLLFAMLGGAFYLATGVLGRVQSKAAAAL